MIWTAVLIVAAVITPTALVMAYAQQAPDYPGPVVWTQNPPYTTVDWPDHADADRYLVQLYAGGVVTYLQFVTESTLPNMGLLDGIEYTITVTPYAGDVHGNEMLLGTATGGQTGKWTTNEPEPETEIPAVSDDSDLADAINNLSALMETLITKVDSIGSQVDDADTPVTVMPDAGDFIPSYGPTIDKDNLGIKTYYQDLRFLESMTDTLNETLALPNNIYMSMEECGYFYANFYYYPDTDTIVICYEHIDNIDFDLFLSFNYTDEEQVEALDAAVTWTTLHELAHALIDAYDLPVVGNEEIAADQFATIITLEYFDRQMTSETLVAMYNLYYEDLDYVERYWEDYAAIHPFDMQRYFNIVCWTYGNDPVENSFLVTDNFLPDFRANQCVDEYDRVSDSWYRLINPFLKVDIDQPGM